MSVRRPFLILAFSTIQLLVAHLAYAWPTGDQFDGDPISEGGGGGVSFTGAPRFAAHDCAVCHLEPARRVRLRVEADPAALFGSGYRPGREYRMRVVLEKEHAAVDALAAGDRCLPAVAARCDDNGFALEIDDAAGRPTGTFTPTGADGACGGEPPFDAPTKVLAAGDAIVHSGYHHGLDAWTFCWTAPAASSGPLTIFTSAVDGNGGDGTNDNPDDTAGDDVVTGAVTLAEAGGSAPDPQSGGCQLVPAGGASDPTSSGLFAASVVGVLALRRRRRAQTLVPERRGAARVVRAPSTRWSTSAATSVTDTM